MRQPRTIENYFKFLPMRKGRKRFTLEVTRGVFQGVRIKFKGAELGPAFKDGSAPLMIDYDIVANPSGKVVANNSAAVRQFGNFIVHLVKKAVGTK